MFIHSDLFKFMGNNDSIYAEAFGSEGMNKKNLQQLKVNNKYVQND